MEKKKGETQYSEEAKKGLLQELLTHFREKSKSLRHQWIKQMASKKLLEGLSKEETEIESTAIYDTCIKCLQTGNYDSAKEYASKMADGGVLRGMTSEQIIDGMLVLRDVYGRSLFPQYKKDTEKLLSALDLYEPMANRILSIVSISFVKEREKTILQEREKTIRQQKQVILELSTPILQLREKLLMLPIIGVIDSARAKDLTEQLLQKIREKRAKVVVMDITSVANVDSQVANHMIQTVEAARLLGATVLVTGLSPEVAQTLVTIGVDLSKLRTLNDLQSGIEEADRLMGYKITFAESSPSSQE